MAKAEAKDQEPEVAARRTAGEAHAEGVGVGESLAQSSPPHSLVMRPNSDPSASSTMNVFGRNIPDVICAICRSRESTRARSPFQEPELPVQ